MILEKLACEQPTSTKKISVLVGLAIASLAVSAPAWANDTAAKDTKVSVSTTYFSTNYDKPGSEFKVSGWIKTLTASQRLNESWTIGGLLSHAESGGEVTSNQNKKDVSSWTPGAFATWNNQAGLYVTGALSHSWTTMTNKRIVNGAYQGWGTETRQFAMSLDATQYIPVTEALLANVGARASRFMRTEDSYIDPQGGNTTSRNKQFHTGALQGGLTYFVGDFTPFASANVTFADENIVLNSDSRSYWGYAAGTGYQITPSIGLNASYSATEGIKYFRDRRYTLNLGYRF